MGRADTLAPLLPALRSLVGWLRAQRTRGVIVGGGAASLLGRPRLTAHIDAVVVLEDDEWGPFVEAGAGFGIVPRRADALDFARRSRVLVAHRPRDVADIEAILAANPRIDVARAREVVREFAAVLEAPELSADLERLLADVRVSPPRRRAGSPPGRTRRPRAR